MTLAIKLAIIAALILSIFIPFGYFLHGERTKKRYKRSIAFNAFFFFGIIVIAGVMMFVTDPVQAAQAGSDAGMATGLGYLAAALSTGLSCVGGGIAVANTETVVRNGIAANGSQIAPAAERRTQPLPATQVVLGDLVHGIQVRADLRQDGPLPRE